MQWGVTVAAALLLAGLATGCDKLTGGGWIASTASPLEKATFGFTAKCKTRTVDSTPTAVLYDGQLEYEDHGADIRIHGHVEPSELPDFQFEGMTCQELRDFPPLLPGVARFEGTYRSQPGGEEGSFIVDLVDGGEPGVGGDMFSIVLTGAIEHINSGPVEGGNIQIH